MQSDTCNGLKQYQPRRIEFWYVIVQMEQQAFAFVACRLLVLSLFVQFSSNLGCTCL